MQILCFIGQPSPRNLCVWFTVTELVINRASARTSNSTQANPATTIIQVQPKEKERRATGERCVCNSDTN